MSGVAVGKVVWRWVGFGQCRSVFSPGFFEGVVGGVGQALGQGGGRNEEREEREKEKQQKGEEKGNKKKEWNGKRIGERKIEGRQGES